MPPRATPFAWAVTVYTATQTRTAKHPPHPQMLRNEFSLGRMHTHNTQTLDMHTHTHTPVRVREKSLFHDFGKCYAKWEWHCRMPKMPGVFLFLLCDRQLHLVPHPFLGSLADHRLEWPVCTHILNNLAPFASMPNKAPHWTSF